MPKAKKANPTKSVTRKRSSRSLSKKVSSNNKSQKFGLSLVAVGLLFLAISVGMWFYQQRVLSFDQPELNAETTVTVMPLHLVIESQKIDLAIEPAAIVDGVWQINPKGVSYLLGSGQLGQTGNVVLYGHNKTKLLGHIRQMKVGDQIEVKGDNEQRYIYQVSKILIVNPNQVEVLAPTSAPTLTLYTCTGLLDTQRFVVKAELVN